MIWCQHDVLYSREKTDKVPTVRLIVYVNRLLLRKDLFRLALYVFVAKSYDVATLVVGLVWVEEQIFKRKKNDVFNRKICSSRLVLFVAIG